MQAQNKTTYLPNPRLFNIFQKGLAPLRKISVLLTKNVAGWSSLVARQAHNLKAAGSNPAPAPKLTSALFYAVPFFVPQPKCLANL